MNAKPTKSLVTLAQECADDALRFKRKFRSITVMKLLFVIAYATASAFFENMWFMIGVVWGIIAAKETHRLSIQYWTEFMDLRDQALDTRAKYSEFPDL